VGVSIFPADNTVRLRLVKPWRGWPAGTVVNVGENVAATLVNRGIAIDAKCRKLERAVAQHQRGEP
jgi:hypothetical protein